MKSLEITDNVLKSYLTAALWSSTDPDTSEPLDDDYSIEDFEPISVGLLAIDLSDFVYNNASDLNLALSDKYTMENVAHDFWLSRNGHGSGFFDRSAPLFDGDKQPYWDRLQTAAKTYGTIDLYPTHDGKIRF